MASSEDTQLNSAAEAGPASGLSRSARSLPVATGKGPTATPAGRPQLMRAINERLLLEHIRVAGPISRAELARTSGLSKPTVALTLANLEAEGLVRIAGLRAGSRGPAAVLYELRPDAGYVLGLDVGREYLRGALADIRGTVLARLSRPAHAVNATDRVGELVALAGELVSSAGVTRNKVSQVVIGSPGVYDPSRGALVLAANVPGWESPKVLAALRRSLGPNTLIENDVDLAALAERDMGHGREVRTFCFVSVGSGTGMGLIIDGQLHRGAHGAAGEIAYLPVADVDVAPAAARRHGLLEAAASASAVVQAARRAGVKAARRAGAHRPVSAREVFEAAAKGDKAATWVVEREAHVIARAVSSVVAVVDPELVVLGGGIGQAPGFADAVAGELARLVPFVPDLKVSALGHDAVVDGSLVLGLERAWNAVLDRPS